MKITKKELKNMIYESVQKFLNESRQGLKSKKLFQIFKEHGKPKYNHHDWSSITDDMVIGCWTFEEYLKRLNRGEFKKFADEHFPGQAVFPEKLQDGYILSFVSPSTWDDDSEYHKKKGERRLRLSKDGKNQYYPQGSKGKAASMLRTEIKSDKEWAKENPGYKGMTPSDRRKAIELARQGKDINSVEYRDYLEMKRNQKNRNHW